MSKRVHLISIGGAVMHNLALCLHNEGHAVSGSDDEIFEPSRSRLESAGLLPAVPGWFPEKITADLDAVILGMHARKDNPELLKALELKLNVYSFPEYVYEHAKSKKRLVIGGSHGKTTTTAIIMHVLKTLGHDFDYLVGSQIEGFTTMVRLSKEAPLLIAEGDEYLNSALDPRPKFHIYRADMAQLTGIAWDHINVFPTPDIYTEQFRIFIQGLPSGAPLAYFQGDPLLEKLVQEREDLKLLPYTAFSHKISGGKTILLHEGREYPLHIFGEHNLQNLSGAQLLCAEIGIPAADFLSAVSSFKGTARRLETVFSNESAIVFRDFAHSPSKLSATVRSVREQYPDRRLVAVYELHTFSSLNRKFLEQYRNSMDQADEKLVFYNPQVIKHKGLEELNPTEVNKAFGGDVEIYTDSSQLYAYIGHVKLENTVLLLMSSGNFDNLLFRFGQQA
jgi:UDP-N-acetylmuramate: L-alanyl-gamma-D-glutamyl-meso-diaminopimelate ligase